METFYDINIYETIWESLGKLWHINKLFSAYLDKLFRITYENSLCLGWKLFDFILFLL